MGGDSDLGLFVAWRNGEQKAGDQLVTKYYGPIRRFFTNSVSDDEFQDLTNETFKRLMTTKFDADGTVAFRTVLYRIARSVLNDHLRKRYRRDARGFDPMTHSVEDVDGVTPSRAVAEIENHRRLLDCLRALPVDTKTLLELYYWQSFTADELALVFEVKPGTIRTRVHAARELLKRGISGDEPLRVAQTEADESAKEPPEDELAQDLRAVGELLISGPHSV